MKPMALKAPLAPIPSTQAQVEEWVRLARKGRGWIVKLLVTRGDEVVRRAEVGDWDLLPQTEKKLMAYAIKPELRR